MLKFKRKFRCLRVNILKPYTTSNILRNFFPLSILNIPPVSYLFCLKCLFPYVLQLSYFTLYCISGVLHTATLFSCVPYKVHTKVFTFVPLSEILHLFCLFPMSTFSLLYGIVLPRSHAALPETRQLPATSLENATQSLLLLSP